MMFQQHSIVVDCPVQSQLAHQFVHGAYPSETNGAGSFGDLIVNVGVFEHRIGWIFILSSDQSGVQISLVTEEDFVVSFVRLECAPYGYISKSQVPIIANIDAHISVYFKLSQ
jgi:hypothetical protein